MNNNDTHGPAPACLRAAVAMNTACPALWWLLPPCSEFEDKGRERDGPRGGAATCDPLLDDARLSFGKRKHIPVYAVITKATIPADPSLLLGAGGPGHHKAPASVSSTESTESWSLQNKAFGSAPCGVAIVAKGDVTLFSKREEYKGTMQTTLAWSNVLFTLPGGFSTGYPFLSEVLPTIARSTHRNFNPAPGDLTAFFSSLALEVVDAGQLWAMCNDAVPVSHPGEITLSLRLDDKEKWNVKKDA